MVVCSAASCCGWRGPPGCASPRRMNFAEGTLWSEAGAGTNALGTALAVGHPMQVFAAEHYNATVHPWTCSAAPIFEPRTGRLLGTIDLTGPFRMSHPHSLALVTAAPPARRPARSTRSSGGRRAPARRLHPPRRPPRPPPDRGGQQRRPRGHGASRRLARHSRRPPGARRWASCPTATPSRPSRSGSGTATWCGPPATAPPVPPPAPAPASAGGGRRLARRPAGAPQPAARRDPRPARGHPEGLSAEAVSAALGPDHPLTSVRSEVSRLRRLLGAASRPGRTA